MVVQFSLIVWCVWDVAGGHAVLFNTMMAVINAFGMGVGTVGLIFCAFMSARAYYRKRIADLEGQMALWRVLRSDGTTGKLFK